MKILPHVNRYTVARAAVITRRKGKQLIQKASSFPSAHEAGADKLVSLLMCAATLAPRSETKLAKSLPQDATPVVSSIVRKRPSKKIKKFTAKIPPKTPDKVKLMAKGQTPNITRLNSEFNDLLLENEKNKNPLNNKVPIFVKCAKKHGVDPVVLMAIAMHESARGTSNAAKIKHNVGGIMNSKNKLKIFSNVELCIDQMAETLAFHHREDKINTLRELANAGMYCDKAAASEWTEGVMYYVNKLQA